MQKDQSDQGHGELGWHIPSGGSVWEPGERCGCPLAREERPRDTRDSSVTAASSEPVFLWSLCLSYPGALSFLLCPRTGIRSGGSRKGAVPGRAPPTSQPLVQMRQCLRTVWASTRRGCWGWPFLGEPALLSCPLSPRSRGALFHPGPGVSCPAPQDPGAWRASQEWLLPAP